MAYTIMDEAMGLPKIAATSTGPWVGGGTSNTTPPLGAIVTAVDPTYGVGEFILLKGVASTIVGSVVTYNGNSSGTPTFQTTIAPSTANLAQPLAVAMSANVANQYGWYQISGNAVMATNGTLAAGPGPVYLAGSGQVTSTAAAGKQVLNAINVTATGTPAANQAVVEINRPCAQGAIT
jgi:hypothetical protein